MKFAETAPYIAAFGFNLTLVVLRVYELSYDAFTHLFFANHYATNWFGIWEYRWYGGFYVTGYTPLTHQIMALLSFLLGISLPYGILAIATSLFLIWASGRFASSLGMQSKMLPWLMAASPGLYVFLYVFGQLPAVLSTALILASCSYLVRYLEGGGTRAFLLAALLVALSFFAHELVAVMLLPVILVISLSKSHRLSSFGRLAAWAAASLLIALPVILGFLNFLGRTPPQAPIPHITRSLLVVGPTSLVFFWGIYGPVILLVPLALFKLLEVGKRSYAVVACLLIVFGLGGTTPIPLALLGSAVYNILTYEKFSFWALLLLLVPLGVFVDKFAAGSSGRMGKAVRFVLVLSLLLSSVGALYAGYTTVLPVARPNVEQVAGFLNSQRGDGYYVTLGLGPLSRELSIMTTKPTLDGGYNTARRLPILAQSGVDSIDYAKYFPDGLSFVKRVLGSNLGVRWVVLGDATYQPLLVQTGYKQVQQVSGSLPVTIWERADDGGYQAPAATSEYSYGWGLVPILTLLCTIFVAAKMT